MAPHDTPSRSAGIGARPSTREQASRIERDYYRRRSPLARVRRWLGLAAVLAGGGWCAWAAVDARRHLAPGPVTAVHATWERDCNACHVPFSPIVDATFWSDEQSRAEGDAKCLPCHRVAAHHPRERAAEVGSCGSCHSDHRGRAADITRVADRTCTACHADLGAHRLAAADAPPLSTEAAWRIEGFDNERHPPFASLREDPGTLIFTHGRHMLPGQYLGATSLAAASTATGDPPPRSRPLAYADLPVADRARYLPPGTSLDAPVQLSCASCHEFGTALTEIDVRQVGGRVAAASPGAYALPVDFQRHCAACHPLPYEGLPMADTTGRPTDPRTGDAVDAVLASVGADVAVVPHGLDAAALRRFLEQTYLARGVTADPALLLEPVVPRPLPAAATVNDTPTRGTAIRDKVDGARRFVRGQCAKCHALEDVAVGNERAAWFRALPSRVPDVWLTKARFDHQAHRQVDCRACHEAAYPERAAEALEAARSGQGVSVESDLVLIAGRESCVECHAPPHQDAETGRAVGGARHDCVECHGYHDRGGHASPWPLRSVTADSTARPRGEGQAALRSRLLDFLSTPSVSPAER